MFQPDWREKRLGNVKKAMKFLEKYHWSSYNELIREKSPLSVLNRELFLKLFDTNIKRHREDLENWLKDYKKKDVVEKFKEFDLK